LEAAGIDMRRSALASVAPYQPATEPGSHSCAQKPFEDLLYSSPPAPGAWLPLAVTAQPVDDHCEEFMRKFKYPIAVTIYSTRRGRFRTMQPCKFFHALCTRGDECWFSHCCSPLGSAVLDELDRVTSRDGWAPYEVFLYAFASAVEHEHAEWIAAMRLRLEGSAYPSAERPGAVSPSLLAIGDAPALEAVGGSPSTGLADTALPCDGPLKLCCKKAAPARPVVATAKFSHQPRRRLSPPVSAPSRMPSSTLASLTTATATTPTAEHFYPALRHQAAGPREPVMLRLLAASVRPADSAA